MRWVNRAFWISTIIYLGGVAVLSTQRPTVEVTNARNILDIVGGLVVLLGLVMLGRWVWSKVR